MAEYMCPRPLEARNASEMARLRTEAAELREFLESERRNGRDLRPASMNARSRLRAVEREIQMAEAVAGRPAVIRTATHARNTVRQEYAPIRPYFQTQAAASMVGNADQSFGTRWARLYEAAHPGERAFV